MILKKLLEYLGIYEDDESEIISLQIDSRKVKDGDVFLAYKGNIHDGNDYIQEAFTNGASAVISDRYDGTRIYYCSELKKIKNSLANYFYEKPFEGIKVIGVTGTNGKTSTATCIYELLNKLGIKTMLIGTNGVYCGEYFEELDNTTPDNVILARLFYNAKVLECEYIVMEVSSHALELKRVNNIQYDIGIFTNISHEHLDFHKTIEDYAKTKSKLFKLVKKDGLCIINGDDDYAKLMINNSNSKVVTYGLKESNNFVISKCNLTRKDSEFILNSMPIKTNLISLFNIFNVTACFIVLKYLGFHSSKIKPLLEDLPAIKGRMESIYSKDFSVLVDFAHTPDAIEKVLSFLKPLCLGKMHVLFGCGGNRDKTKRNKMTRVALKYAEKVVITSDNPRYEDPQSIIDDAINNVENKEKINTFISRTDAIKDIIKNVSKDDIVVLLGKGPEKYQIVKDIKVPYNDKEVFLKCLENH